MADTVGICAARRALDDGEARCFPSWTCAVVAFAAVGPDE